MGELKRFYIGKFEGNVLREFYPEGALKSEAEVKEGKRHVVIANIMKMGH